MVETKETVRKPVVGDDAIASFDADFFLIF